MKGKEKDYARMGRNYGVSMYTCTRYGDEDNLYVVKTNERTITYLVTLQAHTHTYIYTPAFEGWEKSVCGLAKCYWYVGKARG